MYIVLQTAPFEVHLHLNLSIFPSNLAIALTRVHISISNMTLLTTVKLLGTSQL